MSVSSDNEYLDYIKYFFNLQIAKEVFFTRLINISINGRWYADGVGDFQQGMRERVCTDLNLLCQLLSVRSDKAIRSFWYFYFDQIHPDKQLPENLKTVKQIDKRIYTIMTSALKAVQQAWKHY